MNGINYASNILAILHLQLLCIEIQIAKSNNENIPNGIAASKPQLVDD